MPDSTQSQTQQILQNLTGVQTAAQPAANAGAVNNGSPQTVYNIPPQADANGNWWQPQAQPLNPLVASILGAAFRPLPVPSVPSGPTTPTTPPPTNGGGQPTPNSAVPGEGNHPQAVAYEHNPYSDSWGGMCVAADSFLENAIKANQAEAGFVALCHTPEEGFQRHPILAVGPPAPQPCVEIVTSSGARLVCSTTTPFTKVGAESDSDTRLAPEMLGQLVYVKHGKYISEEEVMEVNDAGVRDIVPISYGGRSFPAGVRPDVLIYSHNMRKDNYGVPGIPGGWGMDFAMSPQEMAMVGNGLNVGNSGSMTYDDGYTSGGTLSNYLNTAGSGLQAAGYGPQVNYNQAPAPSSSWMSTINGMLDNQGGAYGLLFDGQPAPRDPDGSVNWVGQDSVMSDILKELITGGF